MDLWLSRLRAGEWLTAAAAILMLIDMFAPAWFAAHAGRRGSATAIARVSLNGWQTSLPAGVLALVVCGGGVGIWLATATRRSPALPVVLNTLLMPLSLALVVLVAVRVLVLPPSVHAAVLGSARTTTSVRPGAWAAVALSVALYASLYIALRREGVAPADAPAEIETLTVALPPGEPRGETHA